MSSPVQQATIRAAIFDMDNTLFDFMYAQRVGCSAVLSLLGRQQDQSELFRYFLRPDHGFESPLNIRDYLADTGHADPEVYHTCVALYEARKLGAITPYDATLPTLEALRALGITLALVTDADTDHARARLVQAGLEEFFPVIVTPDLTGSRKPSHRQFLTALDLLHVTAAEALMVGDSLRRDIHPCNELGLLTAYAAYGDQSPFPSPACVPDLVLESLDQILELFPEGPGTVRQD
jgi:putative hydrolase of the HAD superfamily